MIDIFVTNRRCLQILSDLYQKLTWAGVVTFIGLMIIGTRTFWDTDRSLIPHVFEFNMYQHSISSPDLTTDMPEIGVVTTEGNQPFDFSKTKNLTMGHIHLSDRWDFYPPLYRDFFCNPKIKEALQIDTKTAFRIYIKYIKNRKEPIQYEQTIACND